MATINHCKYCFDVLVSELDRRSTKKVVADFEDQEYPLFVTWDTTKDGDKELRGCIGNFTKMPIVEGLKDYAIISAFSDTRFDPISKSELKYLENSVSLLTDFEEAQDIEDWEVGKHGVTLKYYDERGKKRSATFLPDVPAEQEWTKMETIKHLALKSGYRKRITADFLSSVTVERYQSSKQSLKYSEYIRLKKK